MTQKERLEFAARRRGRPERPCPAIPAGAAIAHEVTSGIRSKPQGKPHRPKQLGSTLQPSSGQKRHVLQSCLAMYCSISAVIYLPFALCWGHASRYG